MQSPDTSSSGSEGNESPRQVSMFSEEYYGEWVDFYPPFAKNLDDIFLKINLGMGYITTGDLNVLDGKSLSEVAQALSECQLQHKISHSQKIFFLNNQRKICVIDCDPTKNPQVQIREVHNYYDELAQNYVSSSGVHISILKREGVFDDERIMKFQKILAARQEICSPNPDIDGVIFEYVQIVGTTLASMMRGQRTPPNGLGIDEVIEKLSGADEHSQDVLENLRHALLDSAVVGDSQSNAANSAGVDRVRTSVAFAAAAFLAFCNEE